MLAQQELMDDIAKTIFSVMSNAKQDEYSMMDVMSQVIEKHKFMCVGADCEFMGEVEEGKFYVPNAYGQEDWWEDENPNPSSTIDIEFPDAWTYNEKYGEWEDPHDPIEPDIGWYGRVDYVMLFDHKVVIVELNLDTQEVTNIIEVPISDILIDLTDFGGKRGYYYVKGEHVQFRTNRNFYDSLPDKYKYPIDEEGLRISYFTIKLTEEK